MNERLRPITKKKKKEKKVPGRGRKLDLTRKEVGKREGGRKNGEITPAHDGNELGLGAFRARYLLPCVKNSKGVLSGESV